MEGVVLDMLKLFGMRCSRAFARKNVMLTSKTDSKPCKVD